MTSTSAQQVAMLVTSAVLAAFCLILIAVVVKLRKIAPPNGYIPIENSIE